MVILYAISAAFMLWLSFPPVGLWIFSPLALLLVWRLVDRCSEVASKTIVLKIALPFSLTFFLLMNFWLRTVHVYVGWPMAILAWLGVALGLALFWVVGFGVYVFTRRFSYPLSGLWFGAVWVITDVLRASGPWASALGVPWTPLIDAPFLPLLARGSGFWGFGLGLWATLMLLDGAIRLLQKRHYGWGMVVFNSTLLLLFVFCFTGRMMLSHCRADGLPLSGHSVALVQGNFDQRHKLDTGYFGEMRRHYLNATQALPTSVDIVFWPETVVPTFLIEDRSFRQQLSAVLSGRTTQIIFGVPVRDQSQNFYNSAVLFDQLGVQGVYTKSALVPFGEYIPFRHLLGRLFHNNIYLQDDYRPGLQRDPLPTHVGRAGVMICFESTLPRFAVQRKRAHSDWLLVLTNDAWFLDSAFAPMHLQMTRWRAVETGIPLFFVANTGISAVIDGAGMVRQQLPLGKRGSIVYHFPE